MHMILDFYYENPILSEVYLILALVVFERLTPRHEYQFNKLGLIEDLFYGIVFIIVVPRMQTIFEQAFNLVRGLSPFHTQDLLNHLPPILNFIILLFIADFLLSATHYSMHRIQFMWKTHILHHSTTQLSLTSAFRVGVGEDVCMALFVMVPLSFMNFDSYIIQNCFTVFGVHGYILHSNLKFKAPKILRFVACPHFHQWHHEKQFIKKGGQNFGITFTFWDMMMNTYIFPEAAPGDYGIAGKYELQGNWLSKYFYPFSTAKMIESKQTQATKKESA